MEYGNGKIGLAIKTLRHALQLEETDPYGLSDTRRQTPNVIAYDLSQDKVSLIKQRKTSSFTSANSLAKRYSFQASAESRSSVKPDLYNYLGCLLHSDGKIDEALQVFQTSIQLQPNNIYAILNW